MILTNDTILRGFLAHMASLIKKHSQLVGSAEMHPNNTPELSALRGASYPEFYRQWEILRRDLDKVLELKLNPLSLVQVGAGPYASDPANSSKDTTRITFGELKKRADKARRKDPTITLLKSWSK